MEERRMMDLNDHMTGSHVLGNRKQEISIVRTSEVPIRLVKLHRVRSSR